MRDSGQCKECVCGLDGTEHQKLYGFRGWHNIQTIFFGTHVTFRTGANEQRQDRFGEGLVAMCCARKGEQEGRHSTYSNAVGT